MEKTDFKSKLQELDEINTWFQSDDIDLDEGLKKLKRAKELIKFCKSRLKDVENEFNTIKEEIENDDYIPEMEEVQVKPKSLKKIKEVEVSSEYTVIETNTLQTSLLD